MCKRFDSTDQVMNCVHFETFFLRFILQLIREISPRYNHANEMAPGSTGGLPRLGHFQVEKSFWEPKNGAS